MSEKNHALVFGASGIQGWAVTNQLLLGYPKPSDFYRVTALTTRPIAGETLWAKTSKLQVASGIDLLANPSTLDSVPSIETVTHVFYMAYMFREMPQEEVEVNLTMLKNAITAVETLSKSLKFVVLATGAKAYGIHLLADFPFRDQLPLSEDLPRIPEPHRSKLFYYHQTDWLNGQSHSKAWTWCELRPDLIVGFVPNNNFYCLAQILATFLALYKATHEEGAECPFPGFDGAWRCLANDSGQDEIAKFAIHAALHPEICGDGQVFNVASQAKPQSWEEKWPILCKFFGLKGTAPVDGGGVVASQYLHDHADQWERLEKDHALVGGRVGNARSLLSIDYGIMMAMDFDRQTDLTRMHRTWSQDGKVEEADTKTVWWTVFQRFRDARIIP